ncbi:hypothetical protein [Streptomyces sp. NPDC002853]
MLCGNHLASLLLLVILPATLVVLLARGMKLEEALADLRQRLL